MKYTHLRTLSRNLFEECLKLHKNNVITNGDMTHRQKMTSQLASRETASIKHVVVNVQDATLPDKSVIAVSGYTVENGENMIVWACNSDNVWEHVMYWWVTNKHS